MGWKQFVRAANAAARRSERAALQRHRELQREHERQAKVSAREAAAAEVRRFENYLSLLVTLHADCGEPWDWEKIAATQAPRAVAPPAVGQTHEALARAALEAYRPGFFDRLFGGEKKARAALEEAVRAAALADAREYEASVAAYREAVSRWEIMVNLSSGVRRHVLQACRIALDHAGAFEELKAFKTQVTLESISASAATLRCQLEDDELVPKEELKLLASGQVSVKEMPQGRYWALYQDHVCSCALRVAREAFAVLPVPSAIVNVCADRLDPSRGHVGPMLLLSVRIARADLAGLKLDAIDPSAAVQRLVHHSGFRKNGVGAVEPLFEAPAAAVHAEPATALSAAKIAEIASAVAAARTDSAPAPARMTSAGGAASPFVQWITSHMAGKASSTLKLKTLVNELGNFRVAQRLSLKAAQDVADVLAEAGFELDPDPRAASQSPGINAWVRVVYARDAEARRAAAAEAAAGQLALAKFLWGAGYRRLYLTPTSGHPQSDASPIESVDELVHAVGQDPAQRLPVLDSLLGSGALESWLEDAQRAGHLSRLAFGIRSDRAPDKARRWCAAARRES